MIYIRKFNYTDAERGTVKALQSRHGRELLHYAAEKELSLDADNLIIAKGKHGKPYFRDLPSLHFNISHSGNYVAVILADTAVGVDVQVYRPIKERIIEKICNDSEKDLIGRENSSERVFIALWSLKESYVKATGTGMTFPMSSVNFTQIGTEKPPFLKISNQSGYFLTKICSDFVLSACLLDENISQEHLEEVFKIHFVE